MRHYFLSRPVAARAIGMAVACQAAGRVAFCRGTLRLPPGLSGAFAAAVDLAAVATAADDDLAATRPHKNSRPDRFGLPILASAA